MYARRWMCRGSTARTWTASRCAPKTRSGQAENQAGPAFAPPGAGGCRCPARGYCRTRNGGRGGDRRRCAARRQRGRDDRAHRAFATSGWSSRDRRRPARTSLSPAPTSVAVKQSCFAALSSRRAKPAFWRRSGLTEWRLSAGRVSRSFQRATNSAAREQPLPVGCVYDSNATVLADAVRELGCEPVHFGIVSDDHRKLREALGRAVAECDAVLLSGGTSKGAGDVSYRVVGELGPPGIVAHGVALKPGKPLCLAVVKGTAPPDPGRGASRLSNIGDLHVPRIRRAGSTRTRGATDRARTQR